jgi:serine phosphatase RsbU (regulator of sigma subunit)
MKARSFLGGLRRGWARFWSRVTEGRELEVLWTQFKTDTQQTYGQYAKEVDWTSVAGTQRWRRPLTVARLFFDVILGKLSPARRLFLLLVLLLVALSLVNVRFYGLPQEVQFLVALAGLFLLLALELSDRVMMKRDLEIAREIQTWLLPESPPEVPGVEIAFATRPANTVAGDYYDAIWRDQDTTGERRLLLVEADVAGKSVPAGLLMATFQASLRTLATLPGTLPELVARLNHYTCASSLGGRRFTTAFLAELEPATRRLTYICAGHHAPILRRAGGGHERLDAGGIPLGIDPGADHASSSTVLAQGDLLIAFTDGVCDAVNESEQDFGEERLLALVKSLSATSASDTLNQLTASVDAFVGSARQLDDITWLVLRVV